MITICIVIIIYIIIIIHIHIIVIVIVVNNIVDILIMIGYVGILRCILTSIETFTLLKNSKSK